MDKERDFITNFDHLHPSFGANLALITEDLRAQCPVAHSQAHDGYWILSRYNDITKTLCDEAGFTSKKGTTIPNVERQIEALPLEADPPDHTKYRSLLTPWLAARKVSTYEPAIHQIVTDLINGFIEQGTCDLMSSFCTLLPALSTPVFMGIERKERTRFMNYIQQIIEARAASNEEKEIKVRQSFTHYILKAIEKRKIQPRDDFFTSLVRARFDGEPLSEKEIVALVFTTLVAGLETTQKALGNLLLSIWEQPNARQHLISNPEAISSFIEESLRYDAPLQYVVRNVHSDTTMHGQLLKADEKIMLLLGSANHDKQKFIDADQFILDRSPNRHLTFGLGIHFCVGAPLVRLEMRIAVEQILRRLPDYQPCGSITRCFSNERGYGFEKLPVTFTPGNIEQLSVLE